MPHSKQLNRETPRVGWLKKARRPESAALTSAATLTRRIAEKKNDLKPAIKNPKALCVLGMHRSGTSTVARAINLLGVHLGDEAKMMPATSANAEGYWEHLEIYDLHVRLLERMGCDWDVSEPLPDNWVQAEAVRPFKDELAKILAANFANHPLWAWKEPRTCILLPLWREVLAKSETDLAFLFVVRNPLEVAGSVMRRDGVPFSKALGIWFHHNIVALKDAAGLPAVFLSYEKLLDSWEPELRRCAAGLGLDWPKDEARFREAMNMFIQPGLRHNRSSSEQLKTLPAPVRELYQLLLEAGTLPVYDNRFEEQINRLHREFHEYASFFPDELKILGREVAKADASRQRYNLQSPAPAPNWAQRLFGKKFCRSISKRLAAAYCWFHP